MPSRNQMTNVGLHNLRRWYSPTQTQSLETQTHPPWTNPPKLPLVTALLRHGVRVLSQTPVRPQIRRLLVKVRESHTLVLRVVRGVGMGSHRFTMTPHPVSPEHVQSTHSVDRALLSILLLPPLRLTSLHQSRAY